MVRASIKSHGHNFVDRLLKHWSKKGTASYPVIFKDVDTDRRYQFTDLVTTSEDNETIVFIREIPE